MYRIFADECIPRDVVLVLRNAGHMVETAFDAGLSGKTDEEIFKHAVKNSLILLTYDRGFGDIFQFDIVSSSGVVIQLIHQMTKEEIINIILAFFSENRNLSGMLVLIGKSKIRIIQR